MDRAAYEKSVAVAGSSPVNGTYSGPRMLIALENFEYVDTGWVARLPLASETQNGA